VQESAAAAGIDPASAFLPEAP